jgi:hypothetical protein
MYEKIRFEMFIIKEVITVTVDRIKRTRSLRPIVNLLDPRAVFRLKEDGPWIKGNYYKYIRNRYVA